MSYNTAQRIGLWAAWECLETMPSGAVLGPTGEVVPVDLKTFANGGWIDQKTNFHFHLDFGTLGTGHGGVLDKNGFMDASISVDTAQRRYGPFAYCPVLIPKSSFDEFNAANSDKLRKENGYSASSKKRASVVDQIFQVIDSGVAVKRDDIKRRVAVNMKVDEWRAHWREAVTKRPELGRSGPKPKRS
ncbi:hypothetical protein [Sulfitobacter litoralis]|nr:hypothetical protein [Sulfitobacter litoralis]HDY96310.1 hypothetical protein [Sulfitobacter litoralis]